MDFSLDFPLFIYFQCVHWLIIVVALGILKDEDGVPEDEENFEEAIRHVNTALNPTKVPHLKFSSHF